MIAPVFSAPSVSPAVEAALGKVWLAKATEEGHLRLAEEPKLDPCPDCGRGTHYERCRDCSRRRHRQRMTDAILACLTSEPKSADEIVAEIGGGVDPRGVGLIITKHPGVLSKIVRREGVRKTVWWLE